MNALKDSAILPDLEHDCDLNADSDSFIDADLDSERLPLCEVLWLCDWLSDLLWLFDFDIEVETLKDKPTPDSDLLLLTLPLSCKLADFDML